MRSWISWMSEANTQWVMVTFLDPLVNSFNGGMFGCHNKLDELYNYFIGLNDKVEIYKTCKDESNLVYLIGFQHVMDVSLFEP